MDKSFLILACLTSCLALVDSESGKTTKKQPNIVFIVADDLGWNDVGWNNRHMITPTLDRLARKGVILNSTYAQPTCTPSRNAYMTGLFPYHTTLQDVIEPSEPAFMPDHLKIMPQKLKELGYDTHMVGKWHLGFCNKKYTPPERGFDSFFGFYVGSMSHYSHVKTDRIVTSLSHDMSLTSSSAGSLLQSLVSLTGVSHGLGLDFRFNESIWVDTQGTYSTHAFAKRAVDIIQAHDTEKPLFMYLPLQAPHSPIEVPKRYEQLYGEIKNPVRRIYSGMVSAIDEAVSQVTSALYEKDMMDNLLLVFTSDNGGYPYMGGNNWPLRGAKNTLWEGGTRVPTFVYSDTLLKKTSYTSNEVMHAVDWFPTFVNIAGGNMYNIDGVNQWPMIQSGRRSSRSEFVYNIDPSGNGALRIGKYKLIVGGNPGRYNDWYPAPATEKVPRRMFKGGRHDNQDARLSSKRPVMLFDLQDDPAESRDLADDLPDTVDAMLARFSTLNATKVPPHRPQRKGEADPKYFGGYWSPGWC